ncbi:uncharacterized protein LOC21398406 [Morus notabilis]|uniref:uncharacterized protein LOC21398406 n=1 Tax=Morus notabilis TaxID=981085 RepID=UPI000CED21D4|nr:uncharacterized protein LOC21398406 [Morus notabilis]
MFFNNSLSNQSHIFLKDPVTGKNQSRDQFWSRVEQAYNNAKQQHWDDRNKRSLQCRFGSMIIEVRKLKAFVRKIENMNPSGASDQDILNQAKALFRQDIKYKKGFRFDHIWHIVKDSEKFTDNVNAGRRAFQRPSANSASPQSKNPTPESPTSAYLMLSTFSLNIDDEDIGGSSPQRTARVKKSELKRKNDEEILAVINTIREQNRLLVEMLKQSTSFRQKKLQYETKKKKKTGIDGTSRREQYFTARFVCCTHPECA